LGIITHPFKNEEITVSRLAVLQIHKEELSFSAGHFTIFSATEREHLHGHNYYVHVSFNINIDHNGLAFDYRVYKNKLLALCKQLDRRFLLAGQSPYLKIDSKIDANGEYILAYFNQQSLPFPKDDVIVMPLTNITIEELSHWFLQKLIENPDELAEHSIQGITVNVFNGPGQSGGSSWNK